MRTTHPAALSVTPRVWAMLRKARRFGPILALRAAQGALAVVILVNAPTTAALVIQAGGTALHNAMGW